MAVVTGVAAQHHPPARVLTTFRIAAPRDLGGRVNHHWSARLGERHVVLRRVRSDAIGDLDYELRVLEELHSRGWPVATALEAPIKLGGAIWCLFEHLPGAPLTENGEAQQRKRGRLLASLHDDLENLVSLGQRTGWAEVRALVQNPTLIDELRRYERFFPEEARILQWHAERAEELLAGMDSELAGARRIVLHGDFAPWNLLYRDGNLTGILDFEWAHRDVSVADFALSWRGKYDALIRGYDEVRPLSDLDWRLLTPIFWAWLLIGLADDLRAINTGKVEPSLPEWSLRLLLRRSPLMGPESEPYPGVGV